MTVATSTATRPPGSVHHAIGRNPSIGSIGDAFDNALMETINGLYKTECVRTTIFHEGSYKTIADIEYATAGVQPSPASR